MANVSSAQVRITVEPQLKAALHRFIELTDDNYNLLNADCLVTEENGMAILSGHADGRWAYSTNLQAFFDTSNEPTPDWVAGAPEVEDAWRILMEGLKDSEHWLAIEYTDVEPGMQALSVGRAEVGWHYAELVFTNDVEGYELTVENLMTVAAYDLEEAVQEVYGWDVMEVFIDRRKTVMAKGRLNPFQLELERVDFREALLAFEDGVEHSADEAEQLSTELLPWLTWTSSAS